MKLFKNYDEQIELLKSRGLIINDEETARQILKEENYYNLINGYKELFLESKGSDQFKKNTTFEDIYELYKFDRDLKNILIKPILMIENTMRSLIAYTFSETHGCDNYLKYSNFETLVDKKERGVNSKKLEKRAELIYKLLSNIQNDIALSISKKEYIKHYIVNHGYIPLWVLVNSITLGRLGLFYSVMIQKERAAIASNWKIPESDLIQYIKFLALYRNLCAHDERIYDYSTWPLIIPNTIYHEKLNIEKNNNEYVHGKTDLQALLIVLKILTPKDVYNTVLNKINGRLCSLAKKAPNINMHQLINKMGLVKDWRKKLLNA